MPESRSRPTARYAGMGKSACLPDHTLGLGSSPCVEDSSLAWTQMH